MPLSFALSPPPLRPIEYKVNNKCCPLVKLKRTASKEQKTMKSIDNKLARLTVYVEKTFHLVQVHAGKHSSTSCSNPKAISNVALTIISTEKLFCLTGVAINFNAGQWLWLSW